MDKEIRFKNFIEKAHEVHGDKYDYSKVNYVNSLTKVCIVCPIHGEFFFFPSDHTHNHVGCQICSGCYRSNKNEFT